MRKLIFDPKLPEEYQADLSKYWDWFQEKFGSKVTFDPIVYNHNDYVEVNWAYIWNKPADIGRRGYIMAKSDDDTTYMVAFEDTGMGIYRAEDIHLAVKSKAHATASSK